MPTVKSFQRWARTMNADPDVGRDARMMVPVFFDRGRRKTKVWVFLGWSQRPVHFWFATPPRSRSPRTASPRRPMKSEWNSEHTSVSLAYPVTAEVYVDRILDRDEFRRHCDRFKTAVARS